MQRASLLFMQMAGQVLPRAGDCVVDAVHRLVKGERADGDPENALDALVREDVLSPQAAYYLRGFQQALNEVQQVLGQGSSR